MIVIIAILIIIVIGPIAYKAWHTRPLMMLDDIEEQRK